LGKGDCQQSSTQEWCDFLDLYIRVLIDHDKRVCYLVPRSVENFQFFERGWVHWGISILLSSEAQKNQPTEREPTSELVFCYLQTD
jgi:hypothetical protein